MPKEDTKSSTKPRNVKNKKLTSTLCSKLREIVIKNKDFTTGGFNLYCNICEKTLSNDIRHYQNTIDNHNKISLHQKNKEIKANNSKKHSLLLNSFKREEEKKITNKILYI
jgi:transcription elongation factor Elf1